MLAVKLGTMESALNALNIGSLMPIVFVPKSMAYVKLIKAQFVLVAMLDMI